MYITYHKSVSLQGKESYVPHFVLNKEIQDYIVKKNIIQQHYMCFYHEGYFFIYLIKGDRIDVQL